ncbi:MAG: DUF3606 domain-containing protein [Chitinophagaceae bacterium]|nr:DUF3606 domain-containing protein [Chitinophagaceae bacterium]
MNYDVRNSGRYDNERINAIQDHEIRYWSNALGCTPEKLRRAVTAVGPLVKDVRKWLAETK